MQPTRNMPAAPRSDFLDRIRVMLTALVVLHHTAIMFGGDGGWYLRSAASSTLAKALLTLLCAVDQSFFMGAFFLLAAYFTPRSFDTKGVQGFMRDRLLRLGLPILVYGFVIGPLTLALASQHGGVSVFTVWANLMMAGTFNIGPLWFAWALLIFSAAYVLVRKVRGTPPPTDALTNAFPTTVRHATLLCIVLAVAAGAFLLRLWVPTGQEIWSLQIGFFSSYIALFAIGIAAAKGGVLTRIDDKIAVPWSWVSLLTIPTLFVYAYLSGAFQGVPFKTSGGWTLPAAVYAIWEPLVACGIILMLLWRFRIARSPARLWKSLAPLVYAAFIVHPPIVVSMGLLLNEWQASSLLKFALAGTLSVTGSFVVAALIIRLPGARRIL